MKFKIVEREVIERNSTDYAFPPNQLNKYLMYDLFKWGTGIYFDEKLQCETVGENWIFIYSYTDRKIAKKCAEFLSQIEKITPLLKTSSEEFEL